MEKQKEIEKKQVWPLIERYRNLPYDKQMDIHYAYYAEMYDGIYPTRMEKVAKKITFEEGSIEDEKADMLFAIWLKKYFNER